MKKIIILIALLSLFGLTFITAQTNQSICPMIPTPMCSEGSIIQETTGEDGCVTEITCISKNTECTSYNVACGSNSTPEKYLDDDACEQWKCVPICSIVSTPTCPEGSTTQETTGDDGCITKITCVSSTEIEENETETENNFSLGQIIRGKVRAGIYTAENGEQIRVRELAQNRIQLISNGVLINCTNCNLTQETTRNKTKFKLRLSNGRNAEIRIMPIMASERALEKLRLRVCSTDNECTIELKSVGQGNNAQVVYEAKAHKTFKIFGLFKAKGIVTTQIDAETGEEVMTKRPWWSFIASEKEE